jgi:signal transduction histidine kinase
VQADHPTPSPRTVRQKGQHFVMFYEKDGFLVDEVCNFVGAGLRAGDTGIVIGTAAHREALEDRLKALDRHPDFNPQYSGRLILLDARQTLSRFMIDGIPDRQRFFEVMSPVVARAGQCPSGKVRAFGEMVALLWDDGNRPAAIELEALWNQLAELHEFSLFCAYPLQAFAAEEDALAFRHVCDAHSHVLPADNHATPPDEDETQRDIARLRQKAQALETEMARRRQLEQQLEQKLAQLAEMDKRKDEFLAMLGHELRNPLAPITTSLCLMRLQQDDPAAVTRAREVIERQVALLTRLVHDLLDVSRIAHGKIGLKMETVTLKSLVDQALETNRPMIEALGHRLTVNLPADSIMLQGDSARLGQVFANLLNNAARYTEPNGEIVMSAEVVKDELLLSVKDNGSGLDSTLREQVFDLFIQGTDPPAHARGGLGVGLSLARAIVELHGGSISAASEGSGMGSEFIVRLPLKSVAPVADRNQQSKHDLAGSYTLR